jgi:Zn-dependent protease with chaperone function
MLINLRRCLVGRLSVRFADLPASVFKVIGPSCLSTIGARPGLLAMATALTGKVGINMTGKAKRRERRELRPKEKSTLSRTGDVIVAVLFLYPVITVFIWWFPTTWMLTMMIADRIGWGYWPTLLMAWPVAICFLTLVGLIGSGCVLLARLFIRRKREKESDGRS